MISYFIYNKVLTNDHIFRPQFYLVLKICFVLVHIIVEINILTIRQ